ncbi:MAG: autotransporter domain-containing protein [Candidatus Spyradosoma sp.]
MFRPKFALPFLCAAGVAFSSGFLRAEEVSADTTIRDVDEFSSAYSADFVVAENVRLTFAQSIDGAFAGTLSGKGSFEKSGEGDLVFGGKFGRPGEGEAAASAFEGYVVVSGGSLTFTDDTELLSGKRLEITNSATLIFSCNGDFGVAADSTASNLAILGHDEAGRVGVVENVGSGTVRLASAEGAELRVLAGTLIVSGNTEFDAIRVAGGAELRVGDGGATGGLSGATTLDEGSTLRFNVSSTDVAVKEALSGAGEIVFDGSSTVMLRGAMQDFTGTLTVNAGTALLLSTDGTPLETRASEVVVCGGSFGGHGSTAGSVNVKGKYVSSGEISLGDASTLGGALYLVNAGGPLKIGGDLNFDSARQEVRYDAETETYSLVTTDLGGRTIVLLSENGCGRAEVAGTANLAGTLILQGAEDLAPGKVAVFLRADDVRGDFQYVVTSDNVMLVSPGVGGIGGNEYGIASIENRKLRERGAFSEHDGISDFVDYLASQTELNRPNEVGQAVNLAMGEALTDTVNNFSPLAHCALPGMAVRQSNLEVDYLQRVFAPGLSAPESPDGLSVPANTQYFSAVLTEFVNNDDGVSSPIYDADSMGVMGGFYRWVDGERLVGASLAIHRGTATPHGFSRGTFTDTAFRARVFAGMMPAEAAWNVLFGASAAVHYYDIDHETGTGTNHAEEGGLEAGAFVAWNMRENLGGGWELRPFARFDFNYVRVDTVRERGSYSALEIDAFGYASFRPRFGFGVEKKLRRRPAGRDTLTLGADFAFVGELGRDPRITSRFVAYENSETTIRGTVEERAAFEFTPRMDFEIEKGWTLGAACRIQASPSGGVSTAFSIGLNSRF